MNQIIDTILLGGIPPPQVLDWFHITATMMNEIRAMNDLDGVPLSRREQYSWIAEAIENKTKISQSELLKKSGTGMHMIAFGYMLRNLKIKGLEKYRRNTGFWYRINHAQVKDWYEASLDAF
jgi:hypothetical protein